MRNKKKRKDMCDCPPLCRELKERKTKKKCSFLNIFGRIVERKEGEELEKIGYGGLLD